MHCCFASRSAKDGFRTWLVAKENFRAATVTTVEGGHADDDEWMEDDFLGDFPTWTIQECHDRIISSLPRLGERCPVSRPSFPLIKLCVSSRRHFTNYKQPENDRKTKTREAEDGTQFPSGGRSDMEHSGFPPEYGSGPTESYNILRQCIRRRRPTCRR